jgi:hypothetical protein
MVRDMACAVLHSFAKRARSFSIILSCVDYNSPLSLLILSAGFNQVFPMKNLDPSDLVPLNPNYYAQDVVNRKRDGCRNRQLRGLSSEITHQHDLCCH